MALLQRWAEVETRDTHDVTALAWATFQNLGEIMEVLLDNDADPNVHFEKKSLLHMCYRYPGQVAMLLKHGADVNARNFVSSTMLHEAARQNYVDVVRILLDYGADQTLVGLRGQTALDIAKEKGNMDIVELLCKQNNKKSL